MLDQLQQRLQTLKSEYESGQKVLADLEAKQANVRDTLLRISGAIQVLEEELANVEASPSATPAEAENDQFVTEVDPS
jgi:predicted  nucleic acid-binding Zn-ribbon protein